MADVIKQCKVCGKDYKYCQTYMPEKYRWQDVACCPEHASEYFAQVELARGIKPKEEVQPVAEEIVEPEVKFDFMEVSMDTGDDVVEEHKHVSKKSRRK